MSVSRSRMCLVSAGLAAAIALVGCGMSEKKLGEAEAKIKVLREKGVPDSVLTDLELYVAQIKGAKRIGNGGQAGKYADSLTAGLAKADEFLGTTLASMGPQIDQMKAAIGAQKAKLSGQQLQFVDSILAIVDDLKGKNQWQKAKAVCGELDSLMPGLLVDEQKAQELKKKLAGGTWAAERTPESEDKKINAVERSRYTFGADGKLSMVQSMKGQSTPYLKEDWEFQSGGTWDTKGDTVLLFITKEKCVRQTFWNYQNKDGKEQWVKREGPKYDTTITNHTKDQYIEGSYVRENFKKVK